MYEIAQENKRLSEPLSRALKEVEALRQALASYDKDKLSLQQTKVGCTWRGAEADFIVVGIGGWVRRPRGQ